MAVESAGNVAGLRHRHVVATEQRSKTFADDRFPGSLFAAQHERGTDLFVRMLSDLREPPNDPVVKFIAALADIILDVSQKFRTITRSGLDREAAPQIEIAGH